MVHEIHDRIEEEIAGLRDLAEDLVVLAEDLVMEELQGLVEGKDPLWRMLAEVSDTGKAA